MDGQDKMGYPKLDVRAARALRPNVHQIRVESILGGQSLTSHFSSTNQFRHSLGIDPSLPIDGNAVSVLGGQATGLLRPTGYFKNSGSTITQAPLWIIPNPKDTNSYVYGATGSLYAISAPTGAITAISDSGSLSSSSGNGAAYYDNYLYLARNTDIARYGPLNGSPSFDSTYWTSTLSKSALANTTYPVSGNLFSFTQSNHILHRHSDGKLYIADVVGNQGTLHVISTTKTTVEGDTDSGSKASVLTFGYGLWPTAIESYGTSLAVALYEGGASGSTGHRVRAKLAFWDTTSQSFNSIIWDEFPDPIIVALKNINGVLYIISSEIQKRGFRVSRYVGGTTIKEVFYSELGSTPLPGGVEGIADRLFFGSGTYANNYGAQILAGVVFSLGLQKSSLGVGLFTPYKTSQSTTNTVTAIAIDSNAGFAEYSPVIGWSAGGSTFGIDVSPDTYLGGGWGSQHALWWSQIYRIGQPFKITKIRIPLAQPLDSTQSFIPKIYLDSGARSKTLTTVNSTNYGISRQNILIRPENLTGDSDFFLELEWGGSGLCVVGLPIIVEYELLDVDSALV